jgi:hypothetical protein
MYTQYLVYLPHHKELVPTCNTNQTSKHAQTNNPTLGWVCSGPGAGQGVGGARPKGRGARRQWAQAMGRGVSTTLELHPCGMRPTHVNHSD